MPEAWASAWTCTLPSALPVMVTSPEVLVSSRRVGPLTLGVGSKLPLTDGPIVQPAPAKAANSKPGRAAKLRCLMIPPCEFRAKDACLQPQSKAGLKEDTRMCGIMFRTRDALKSVLAAAAFRSASLGGSLRGPARHR